MVDTFGKSLSVIHLSFFLGGGGGGRGEGTQKINLISMKRNYFQQEIWGAGWRSGRALASHQCGPGLIPGLSVMCGLSLLVLYSAQRSFSPGTPVFPSPQKPTFDLFDLICVVLS